MQLRKISSPEIGSINIVTTTEKMLLYNLKDISTIFHIKQKEARETISSNHIFEIKIKPENSKESYQTFIDFDGVEKCHDLSEDEDAHVKLEGLRSIKEKMTVAVYGYTIDDLKNEDVRFKLIKRLNELEIANSVYEVKIAEDKPKVNLVDKLYGTNVPLDLSLIITKIKFKNISYEQILEELRIAGIFDNNNRPYQKYIDKKYFRYVTIQTLVKASEITQTRVLFYSKAVKLVEDLIIKKAGKKDGTTK